jgi:multicomponent Na+:H+ antiporter subunit F
MNENSAHIVIISSFVLLLMALLLAFFRLAKGPSVNDRIASLDLIASIVAGFILIYAVLVNETLFIDIVIIIALVSFIGTVAISTYLKQKNKDQ